MKILFLLFLGIFWYVIWKLRKMNTHTHTHTHTIYVYKKVKKNKLISPFTCEKAFYFILF